MRKFYSTAANRIGETSSSLAGAAAGSMFSGTLPAGVAITGQKAQDIRTIRNLTGLSVAESKEIVEKIYAAQEKKFEALDEHFRSVLVGAVRAGWSSTEIRDRFEKVFNNTVTPF